MRSPIALIHMLLQSGHDLLLPLLWLLSPKSPPRCWAWPGPCASQLEGLLSSCHRLLHCSSTDSLGLICSDSFQTCKWRMFASKCVGRKCPRAVRPSGVLTLVVYCLWTEKGSPWRKKHHLGDKTRFRISRLTWDVRLVICAPKVGWPDVQF